MAGAIIIGAGPGIGMSVARRVAGEGLPVGVIARSQATVDAALAALSDADALGVAADATDEAGLRGALDEITSRFGVPELLVYNAALVRRDTIEQLSAHEQLGAWAVNVVGAIVTVAHLGPRMAAVGHGTIVLTGGLPRPIADVASLSLGKAGIRTLTELLAQTYGPAGIHVATVIPDGAVVAGTALDPDLIAEHYWALHRQPAEAWEREVVLPAATRTDD